jgi:hypothetical protein
MFLEKQNEQYKEKIDEINLEKSEMEDELNRLIECLREHEAEKQNEQGESCKLIYLDLEMK